MRVQCKAINFNIRCFEMTSRFRWHHPHMINFNIRCFEMGKRYLSGTVSVPINFNIRCFEMEKRIRQTADSERINFNIRCFEMLDLQATQSARQDKLQHKMF